jgi:hypothetical protein
MSKNEPESIRPAQTTSLQAINLPNEIKPANGIGAHPKMRYLVIS